MVNCRCLQRVELKNHHTLVGLGKVDLDIISPTRESESVKFKLYLGYSMRSMPGWMTISISESRVKRGMVLEEDVCLFLAAQP